MSNAKKKTKEIVLIKKLTSGKDYIWSLRIGDTKVQLTHGQLDGKLQKEEKDISDWKPKNIGKKNATTNYEQAVFELVTKAKRKVDEGYIVQSGAEYIKEYISETYVPVDISIPKPTLAKNASPYAKEYNTSLNKIKKQKKILVQRKFDGNRALINIKTGKIFSRSRKLINSVPHLGEYVIDACKKLPKEVLFVDGELFSSDLTFNEIQSILRKSKVENIDLEEAKKIKFNLFDIVTDDEQVDRTEMIKANIVGNEYVNVVETFTIDATLEEIQRMHDIFVAGGDEGAIIRFFKDGGYQQRRSNFMYKFKNFVDDEFEVIKMYSEKKDVNKLGGITLKDSKGNEFNALPSMTDKEKDYLFSHQREFIGQMATVRYQKLDDKTGVPIFGTIKGFRIDGDK